MCQILLAGGGRREIMSTMSAKRCQIHRSRTSVTSASRGGGGYSIDLPPTGPHIVKGGSAANSNCEVLYPWCNKYVNHGKASHSSYNMEKHQGDTRCKAAFLNKIIKKFSISNLIEPP
ncbi:hypothetical protein BDQ17DRAFT_1325708 [Cyathus striatus]|nr:hypothetical protein BDQ17DRAFT_1325708 [Cyathus striatus]